MTPGRIMRVLFVLTAIRDALIILLILAIFGLGAYAWGQLAGWAERAVPIPPNLTCDATYPDALPC